METSPPERIDLPGLLLRRPHEDDAGLLADTVRTNLAWLSEWLPWAAAATTVDFHRQRIGRLRALWDEGRHHEYLAVDPSSGHHLGNLDLDHRPGEVSTELGYWFAESATGRGRATVAARALTEIALARPGVERVEIHCDPANRPSRRVAERLGYRLDRVEPDLVRTPAETGQIMIWVYPA